jgi:indole-3-glycerol phosphate synthase
MNILDEIMKHKRTEVDRNSVSHPIKSLEKSIHFNRTTFSLKKNVLDKTKHGIIAEIKRKSPSKGIINPNVSIDEISKGYVAAGVSAISVLTDADYFGGSNNDLMKVRELNDVPILRKDFILDEYQIVEAKSIGADAILLIAAALPAKDLKRLSLFATSLGLEILLEVHNERELIDTQDVPADLVGVNNRNLQTFEVAMEVSKQLISKIRRGVATVSESGIENPSTIKELRALGYAGFLIGQSFMQTSSPGDACRDFINELKS